MHRTAEYCPVASAAAIVSERWNLLIIRELFAGSRRFNELHRGLPGLSRTLLSQRLRSLKEAGVVTSEDNRQGYQLTAMGQDLFGVVHELGTWSVRWLFTRPTGDGDVDASLLLWRMSQNLVEHRLPAKRVTVEILFDQSPSPFRGWLVLDGDESSACVRHPMFDVDLYARAPTVTWHEIWYGHRTWQQALGQGSLDLCGHKALRAAFPTWFALSPFAEQVAARRADR